ncbi:hypothetical protein BJX64DRAFT_167120 [Aspergillus heterothallicus]
MLTCHDQESSGTLSDSCWFDLAASRALSFDNAFPSSLWASLVLSHGARTAVSALWPLKIKIQEKKRSKYPTDHSGTVSSLPPRLSECHVCSGLHPFGFPSLHHGECAQRPLDDKGQPRWAMIAVQSVIILMRMTSQPTSNPLTVAAYTVGCSAADISGKLARSAC